MFFRKQTLIVMAGAVSLLFLHCAYLNTLYNAKGAFAGAHKIYRKQKRQYPDSTIVPSGIAAAGYDRAIDKAGKVLDVYPKKIKWHDDAVFLMGKALFYKQEYTRAIRMLRNLQKAYPGSPFIPESYLLLGQAYMYDGNLEKAEDLFMMIIDTYPYLNTHDEVSLLLADLAIRREGNVLAIELLEKIQNSVRSHEKRIELILQTARLYIELGQHEKAMTLIRKAPRKEKLVNQMFRLDYTLLDCYLGLDSLEQARVLAGRMLVNRRYSHYEARIMIRKAAIITRMGMIDEAIELLEKITQRYEDTDFAGEAWFDMGLIYQKHKGDFVKARECFESAAAKAGDKSIVARATAFKSAIDRIDTLRARENAPPDTADSISRAEMPPAYVIGELFWLELDEPDSAFNHFVTLAGDTTLSDSVHSKSLYASAWISLNIMNDTSTADSLYGLLTAQYPENLFSKRAQRDLGLPVTIMTREDRAYEAFRSAESLYYDSSNALEAARAYLRVHKEFPDCEAGPQSLYAAAWLCDNVLHKNETAKTLYEKLCKDYPGSEYCLKEAKPRVKTALDTLAVLLEEKERREKESGGRKTGARDSAVVSDTGTAATDSDTASVEVPDAGDENIGE